MKNRIISLVAMIIMTSFAGVFSRSRDYAGMVNPLTGTAVTGLASGYLYPGATYPFGMVQFTPSYFAKCAGFVINQLSGGGCDHMGNFPTFPVRGRLEASPDRIRNFRIALSEESGHAGYYEAMVQDDIRAMLTVTKRTGMAQYIFPEGDETGTVIIGAGLAATPIQQAAVAITGPGRCEGYATGGSFCGYPTPYKVYFVAEFDTDAVEVGTWKGEDLRYGGSFAEGEDSGVYFTFDLSESRTVRYKIGVSYVSVENARLNLETENPGWDFEGIKNAAEAEWNSVLGKIEVEGTNEDRMEQFYTHLYRSLIHPNICNDVNGEYMGADFKVHKTLRNQYTSFSNWDTYRTQIQLLSILDPEVASDIVVSHQDFAEQAGGSFPRWVMANIETGIMQGDPTPILIANAFAFGARNYDPQPIFRLMELGARVPGSKCQDVETRPGLAQYLEKGYYKASAQLEYTSADFAIGQFAVHAAGNEFASWYYFDKARSWRNLYNPETGWLQSRNPDGSWKPLTEDFLEATYADYYWMVPYDLAGLIALCGGNEKAEARLDKYFIRLDAKYNEEWFASGNEPSFHIPWVYNWTGSPYKTQAIVNRIINEQYSSRKDGLPGNDDLGTMGAWYVFACIGLYPEIPGVGGFTVNTPIFESVVLHLKNGDLVIRGGSEKNIYIHSMKIDGQEYDSTWIDWERLENGAVIEYRTSSRPDRKWGTEVTPPSYS